MPYVSQVRHIDRSEGDRRPDALIRRRCSRLVSSYRRSLEQYHLDPGLTKGPRILSAPELRDVQHRQEDRFCGHQAMSFATA